MSNPGLGAMIHYLSGGNRNDPSKYVGKTIVSVTTAGDALGLRFDDGVSISVQDDGQSCCESRYMRTDDDLQSLVGQKLAGIEVNEARRPDHIESSDEYHEVVFLDVKTDQQVVSFSFHNEHNGYYGGFRLSIVES